MPAIRDASLAPLGRQRIQWVQDFMPVLSGIREDFEREQPFRGLRIAVSVHMEAKTAYLTLVLRAGGAQVRATGSNPLSTKDDVCAALAAEGVEVFGWFGATEAEYREHLRQTLEFCPHIVIDDGGDLVNMLLGGTPGICPGADRRMRGDHHRGTPASGPGPGGAAALSHAGRKRCGFQAFV